MIADVPRLGAGIPLVARRAEMNTLREAWHRARSAAPSLALVSGDAGVGKSRLLTELSHLAREESGTVLTGRCLDTTDAALPYLPFAEIVGQLAALAPDIVDEHPALHRLLPGRGEREPSPGEERELGRLQLFDAVYSALDRFATRRPLVLAVEDLHWADRSTRDLFAFLVSRLAHQRLLVIGTYRTDDLHRRHPLRPLLAELMRVPATERLQLEPFSGNDTRAFVRALADESLDEDTIARIAERCEGNAFVAEELVSASGGDAVPHELAEVLLARTERLSPNAQQTVRLASVIGRRFGHERISGASRLGDAELDEALREAIANNILVMDDAGESYAFRHALLREAVYTDLLPGERSRLHREIAASLSTSDGRTAAELAHHAMASHDSVGALAASVRAANQAEALSAPAEMLAHVERALQLWHGVDDPESITGRDELELTICAAAAAAASGDPDRAIAHSRSAIRLVDDLGDTRRAVEVRRAYAHYLLTLENTQHRAYDIALEAWELVADEPPSPEKARVQAVLARSANAAGKREEVPGLAAAAIDTARALEDAGTPSPAGADALVTRIAVVDRAEQPTDAVVESFAAAAATAHRLDAPEVELRARFQGALTLLDAARLSEAGREFDAAAEHADRAGLRWSAEGLEIRVLHVICRYMCGDWDGAEADAELAGAGVSGTVMTRLSAAGMLVAVGRGDFDIADRRLSYVRDNWEIDLQVLILVGLCGAELETWRGRPDRAVRFAEESLERLHAMDRRHLAAVSLCAVAIAAHADIADAARRSGDADAEAAAIAAGRRLAETAEAAVRQGQPLSASLGAEGRAWHLRARAEASRLGGAGDPAAWRAVVDAFGGYGDVYRHALAQWRLAEALLSGGDPAAREEAARLLRDADGVACELCATPLRRAIEDLSRRARLHATGQSRASDNPLTPRELAVLRLAADGKTNRQIGAELYISDKTVSVHLSRVMSKLDARSRTEAVSAAHTRGLLTPSPAP